MYGIVKKNKTMKNNPKILIFLEILGILVLALVVMAILKNLSLYREFPPSNAFGICAMVIGMVILLITSLIRLFRVWNYKWLGLLGITLLIIGGYVIYSMPIFFHIAASLPIPFWNKVIWYTLPAIMIEGGLFTLFIVFIENGTEKKVSSREKQLLSAAFFLYAIFTVTFNFLVLNNLLIVESHVLASQYLFPLIMMIAFFVIVKTKES